MKINGFIPRRLRHSYGHWTPRYIYDRLAVMWFQFKNPDAPWLTKTAVEFLHSWLSTDHIGLEWGSGRSTIWLARRIKHLTSVEHSEDWFDRLVRKIDELHLDNITYLYKSDLDQGLNSSYVRVVDEFPHHSLDFVLVDGALRDLCAFSVLPLLKPGGVLMIDNVNWYLPCQTRSPSSRTDWQGPASPYWAGFNAQVSNWRYIWTTNGVWDTAIWIKPAR